MDVEFYDGSIVDDALIEVASMPVCPEKGARIDFCHTGDMWARFEVVAVDYVVDRVFDLEKSAFVTILTKARCNLRRLGAIAMVDPA